MNVIDYQGLSISPPYYVNDSPGGAGRWLQNVTGYKMTIAGGKVTYRDGVPTGCLPGRLVRNPKSDRSAWHGAARAVPKLQSTPQSTPDVRAKAPGEGVLGP